MSAPVRFLALVVTGWAVVRATALGAISGFTVTYATPRPPPPLVPTTFPPLPETEEAAMPEYVGYPVRGYQASTLPAPAAYPLARGYYQPAYLAEPALSAPIAPRPAWHLPVTTASIADTYSPLPPLPAAYTETAAVFPQRSVPVAITAAGKPPKIDRWQMSTWALLRGVSNPDSLATGGTLGGSQAGARVLYSFTPSLGASLRTSSPVGGSRGAEVAAGVRWAPLRSIPIAITAERRQSISRFGGRSAFALFVEGGLYRRAIPLNLRLDGYFQAGIVGISRRDLFADGQLAVSRPVWGRFSAGVGVWGGVQPGLYRVDAGPRISMRVRDNIYAHADWRQRVAGSALPASGPALTLAADF